MRKVLLLEAAVPGVVLGAGDGVEVVAGVRAFGGGKMGRAVECAIDRASGGDEDGAHGGPGGQGCLCPDGENVWTLRLTWPASWER